LNVKGKKYLISFVKNNLLVCCWFNGLMVELVGGRKNLLKKLIQNSTLKIQHSL